MVKLSIKNNKRVIFPKGEQQDFLLKAVKKLDISWSLFADKLKVHKRTFNDWRRETYSLSLKAFKEICNISGLKPPENIKIKDAYWYVYKGAKKGGIAGAKACYEKYGAYGGNPEYRKKKWYEWWEKKGKYSNNLIIGEFKYVCIPNYSKKLAEFIGIVMGDGGITKYQIIITLNSKDDKEYINFVRKLGQNLLKIPIPIFCCKNQLAMKLIISRKKLVDFLVEKSDLKTGNKLKQGLDIPNWIQKNLEFQKACIRGLIDTDGCVYDERHNINGKVYSYKRLNFTSRSAQLRNSVFSVLDQLGLSPKMRNNRSVQIENKEMIKRYFSIIGTNNPKHLKRYYN